MRRGKLNAQQKLRNPVKQHTPTERLALRRLKRKSGPSGKRRAERRKAKQEAHALAALGTSVVDVELDAMIGVK